jgi:hypothetical protein
MITIIKSMTEHHYNDKSLFFEGGTPRDGVIIVKALIFYEGTQTDSLGNRNTYSVGRLQRIVDNSNRFLKEGNRIPLFKDHNYSQDSVIGQVLEGFTVEEITADKLPTNGLKRLIGRQGVYAQVQISGEENVTKYGDGRIKTLSVGINLSKELIYEVSVVPFPAVAGASLFEDSQHALSLGATEEERKSPFMYFSLFEETVNSIDQSSEANKDELKRKAIADLGDKLTELLGVSPPSTIVPLFSKDMTKTEEKATPETPMDEAAIAQYEARIKELESAQARYAELQDKLAQLERTNEVTAKYTELKDRAIVLRDAGKMTPAAYKEYFGDPKQAIATYSAVEEGKDIAALEAVVSYLETYGAPVVEFGRKTPLEDVEITDGDDLDAEAQRILNAASKYGKVY